MAQQNINPGSAPILWSSVDDAFKKINTNFTELYLSVSGGGTAVDLESLSSNLIPSTSGAYDLGSTTKRWRDIYLTGNSIDLGGALITSPDGVAVNLPTGSTIGGSLIRNPSEGNFTFVAVSGQTAIQADSFSDTLNIAAGNSGILLTTTPGTDTLTISNSGVTLLTGTTGQIGVSGDGTGSVTLTNLGVTVLTGTVGQIGVSGDGTGAVTLTNLGVTRLVASTGINISPIGGTGEVTITNSLPAGPTFRNIAVANQLTVEADNTADTLTLVGSGTVSITTNNVTDTITFTGSSSFDLKGSVFGDDSTKIIDAVENKVYGGIFATTLRTEETKIALGASAGSISQGNNATAVGWLAGYNTQGTAAVAVGREAGEINQGQYAVSVGPGAGYTGQGANAIAIGYGAGETNQPAGSIVLNASGSALNGAAAGFYINPVRSTANGRPLMYDTSTKELFSSNVLEFIGSTISTSDSSGLTVDVQTTFNSDVTIDNELTVTGNLIVNGTTTTINSVTLTVDDKNIELGSTASPTDTTADGGGITLKGSTDKTFNYVNSTGLWTANIGISAASFTGAAAAATTASTAASVGYMGLPQSATATTATLAIDDAGKHIYVTTNTQTITIPANSVVAYPIGTAITFIAGPSATTMTIANNDTMYLVGAGTSGSRTLAAYGSATAIKVSATVWFIAGSGLT